MDKKSFLKPEIVDLIKKDQVLKGLLASHLKISTRTLEDVLKEKDPRFTQVDALNIINVHMGASQDITELLEMQPV